MSVPSSVELVQRLLVPLQLWQWSPEPVIPCSALAIICLPWEGLWRDYGGVFVSKYSGSFTCSMELHQEVLQVQT